MQVEVPDDIKRIENQDIMLEKIRFALRIPIEKCIIQGLTVEQFEDFITDTIIYQLRGFFLGKTGKPSTTGSVIKFDSWWEDLKYHHFPEWLKKKMPPKFSYEPIKLTVNRMCPHIDIDFRKDPKVHFRFLDPDLEEFKK